MVDNAFDPPVSEACHRIQLWARLGRTEVTWENPASQAVDAAGAKAPAPIGRVFEVDCWQLVTNPEQSGGIRLLVQRGKRAGSLSVGARGRRYPQSMPIEAARRRFDEILGPLPDAGGEAGR